MARGPLMSGLTRLGLAFATGALVLDQISKFLLLQVLGLAAMGEGGSYRITSFFNIVMAWNEGVSFGLFPADSLAGRALLVSFSLGVVSALGVWLFRVADRFVAVGIGLIIGGALGNVIDRLRFGAVADFFDFHAFGYHWYVFNVADAAIVIGVGLLVFESLFRGERAKSKASD
jgi:signal peptidase II